MPPPSGDATRQEKRSVPPAGDGDDARGRAVLYAQRVEDLFTDGQHVVAVFRLHHHDLLVWRGETGVTTGGTSLSLHLAVG